jgi:hypothetical protein
MGAVIKFRAKLTPYDIEMATSFGRPLREYAERLAKVQRETRIWERERECALNKSPSAAGRLA